MADELERAAADGVLVEVEAAGAWESGVVVGWNDAGTWCRLDLLNGEFATMQDCGGVRVLRAE